MRCGSTGAVAALLRAASSRTQRLSFSRGSSRCLCSSSVISAMKRLGWPGTISRPFLRRLRQLTASVALRARDAHVHQAALFLQALQRVDRSLGRRCDLNGSRPSLTPTSITCGHSRPLAACSVDSVTTFCVLPRSLMVEQQRDGLRHFAAGSCARLDRAAPSRRRSGRRSAAPSSRRTPARWSSARRRACSLSSPSYRCFS